ncbi:MAG: accessory factor UbiK family protein [Pseudohongiellaceae bacterium]
MSKNDLFEEFSQRMASLLPMAEEMSNEAKAKLSQGVKHALKDMDILSREEFNLQAEALRRAEQRIDELEQSLAKLEKAVLDKKESSTD